MIVSHPCQCCPTILTYQPKIYRGKPCLRKYCAPCLQASIKASKAKSLKMIRERFGRYQYYHNQRTYREVTL